MVSTRVKLLAALVATAIHANGYSADAQLPFQQEQERDEYPLLNFSSPSPLIFHSVFGLLQQWPNTFFEYGHTIAPCVVPKNTNLYHAHYNGDPPPSPEWFGFDAEMSYAILGTLPNSHMLTYRTVRDVQCLYFDGASASLMHDGDMDSQMVFIHNSSANVPDVPRFGRPPPKSGPYNDTRNWTDWNPLQAEYDRARGLCDFFNDNGLGGLGWGYEGVVRMNAGFEMIWCNFSSPSAKLVSWLNVSAPLLDGDTSIDSVRPALDKVPSEPQRNDSRRRSPIPINHPFQQRSSIYDWFASAAKRYGFAGSNPGRGETRVKIDSCGLFTLYDPVMLEQERARIQMERSQFNISVDGHWISPNDSERTAALTQLSRRRRMQRASNVTESDGKYMRHAVQTRMRGLLGEQRGICSGIDWIAITRDIVSDYGLGLTGLASLLSNFSILHMDEARERLRTVRESIHRVYMPYYEYPSFTKDTLDIAFSTRAPQSKAALERCTTRYKPADLAELSTSENVTYGAIEDALSAICDTMLPVFLSVERSWLRYYNNVSHPVPGDSSSMLQEFSRIMRRNQRSVEELMAWLGWVDQWTACSPGCELGEICYIPMWPAFFMWEPDKNHTGKGNRSDEDPFEYIKELLWEPRCVDIQHFPHFRV